MGGVARPTLCVPTLCVEDVRRLNQLHLCVYLASLAMGLRWLAVCSFRRPAQSCLHLHSMVLAKALVRDLLGTL